MVDSGGPAARFLGNLSFAALGIGYGRDLLGTDPSQCSRQRTPDERQFPLGSRSGRGMIGEEAADPVEESSQQRADLVEDRWLDEVIRLHLDTVEDDDLRRRRAGVADLERDGRASLFAADLDGWPLENDFILEGAGVINATIEVHAAWNDNRPMRAINFECVLSSHPEELDLLDALHRHREGRRHRTVDKHVEDRRVTRPPRDDYRVISGTTLDGDHGGLGERSVGVTHGPHPASKRRRDEHVVPCQGSWVHEIEDVARHEGEVTHHGVRQPPAKFRPRDAGSRRDRPGHPGSAAHEKHGLTVHFDQRDAVQIEVRQPLRDELPLVRSRAREDARVGGGIGDPPVVRVECKTGDLQRSINPLLRKNIDVDAREGPRRH